MGLLNKCQFCREQFGDNKLIQCLHCDKRFCAQCITPCTVALTKTLTPNGVEMDPLNKCDFCHEHLVEYQLIRCFHCDKIFCQKCTHPCQVFF